MTIYDILTEHNVTIREVSENYAISHSTLADAYSKPVDKWSVRILRATAEQLELPLDDLVEKLKQPTKLQPFIKWVGGKRQLLAQIDKLLPTKYNTYFEPFIGGGALLLHLQPNKAVINDLNSELSNTWQIVQKNPVDLHAILRKHQENNSKEYFLDLRVTDRDGRLNDFSDVERAARFIYLNKTAFNGLWRVNSKGQHNVPYGKYKNPLIDNPIIDSVSNYLQSSDVKILNTDYQDALQSAKKGDFVYIDSPYDVVSETALFTSYNAGGFGRDEQVRLRDEIAMLTMDGVQVMASNADTPFINEIYAEIPGITIHKITAKRTINSKADKRGPVGEVLITNY